MPESERKAEDRGGDENGGKNQIFHRSPFDLVTVYAKFRVSFSILEGRFALLAAGPV
ncbi:MAG TPA: hypothetical protein VMF53_15585 [Alphaproteobacteria bacterium]|nr:hypothetical protein [Alphaproteobacteria bacterium]